MNEKAMKAALQVERKSNEVEDKIKKLRALATDLNEGIEHHHTVQPRVNAIIGGEKETTQEQYFNTLAWIKAYDDVRIRLGIVLDYIVLCDEHIEEGNDAIYELIETLREKED